MKNLSLLTWLTQLGLSVALPLGGMILLAVWLNDRFSLGTWVIWVGAALGLIFAVQGLRANLKALSTLAAGSNREEAPPVSFNDHK